MARARSPSSIEAEQLYHDGMKLVDIAKKLGVPASTVRRWKSTQKWDENKGERCKKKQSERSDNSDEDNASARKPRGAPKGNKNAVGHASSVPLRNTNAEKHGAYSKIYWDSLDDEELQLMQAALNSEEEMLQQQIAMYTVRERKFMHRLKDFKEKSEDVDIEYAIKGIASLEAELTKIQRAKTKCIDSLIRLRIADERYDHLLNGWATKTESEGSGDDNDESDVMIYLPENGRDKK